MAVDLGVSEHLLESMIKIPVIARQKLVIPNDLAGIDIESKRRIGVEHGAVAGAAHDLAVRDRAAGSPIDQIERRIVTTRRPHRTAVALFGRQAVPAVVAWGAWLRNRLGAPDFGTGLGVERDNEAAAGAGIRAAGNASNDFPVRRQRSGSE